MVEKKPQVLATCELYLSDGAKVDHARVLPLIKAIRSTLGEIYPEHRVAGAWVGLALTDEESSDARKAAQRARRDHAHDVSALLARLEILRHALADLLNATKEYDFDDASVLAAQQKAGRVLQGQDE